MHIEREGSEFPSGIGFHRPLAAPAPPHHLAKVAAPQLAHHHHLIFHRAGILFFHRPAVLYRRGLPRLRDGACPVSTGRCAGLRRRIRRRLLWLRGKLAMLPMKLCQYPLQLPQAGLAVIQRHLEIARQLHCRLGIVAHHVVNGLIRHEGPAYIAAGTRPGSPRLSSSLHYPILPTPFNPQAAHGAYPGTATIRIPAVKSPSRRLPTDVAWKKSVGSICSVVADL